MRNDRIDPEILSQQLIETIDEEINELSPEDALVIVDLLIYDLIFKRDLLTEELY